MPKIPKMKYAGTIDLEPKWVDVCRMAERIPKAVPELMPACQIADVVRQAQKHGKKGVMFTFPDRKTMKIKEMK